MIECRYVASSPGVAECRDAAESIPTAWWGFPPKAPKATGIVPVSTSVACILNSFRANREAGTGIHTCMFPSRSVLTRRKYRNGTRRDSPTILLRVMLRVLWCTNYTVRVTRQCYRARITHALKSDHLALTTCRMTTSELDYVSERGALCCALCCANA